VRSKDRQSSSVRALWLVCGRMDGTRTPRSLAIPPSVPASEHECYRKKQPGNSEGADGGGVRASDLVLISSGNIFIIPHTLFCSIRHAHPHSTSTSIAMAWLRRDHCALPDILRPANATQSAPQTPMLEAAVTARGYSATHIVIVRCHITSHHIYRTHAFVVWSVDKR
jgi:hypothetical protein